LVNIASSLREGLQTALENVGTKLSSFSGVSVDSLSANSTTNESLSDIPEPASPTSNKETEFIIPAQSNNIKPTSNGPQSQTLDKAFDALVENFRSLERSLFELMNHDSFLRYKDSQFFIKLESESRNDGATLKKDKMDSKGDSKAKSGLSKSNHGSSQGSPLVQSMVGFDDIEKPQTVATTPDSPSRKDEDSYLLSSNVSPSGGPSLDIELTMSNSLQPLTKTHSSSVTNEIS